MDRGIYNNISKINTFIQMSKSNDYLHSYVEKIFNNKIKSNKFNSDYNNTTINLLYSALELMTYKGCLNSNDYNKLDKKELKYYIGTSHGIDFFSKQVKSLKNERLIVDYIKKSLEEGSFICGNDNNVILDNGLTVDSTWLNNFTNFLIESFYQNRFVSKDSKKYLYRQIIISDSNNSYDDFIKNIKIYEYSVSKKNKIILSFADIKYLNDVLHTINNYDFDKLKELNSILTKDNYTLSVNKSNPTFNIEQRSTIKNMLNEEKIDEAKEYINDILNSAISTKNQNREKCLKSYDFLKNISYAYKNNLDLETCRTKFDIEDKDSIISALTIGDIYINYIYDEKTLDTNFDYSLLQLDDLKPDKIDYETYEYKKIINDLSNLNKKIVGQNRKINRFLNYDKEKRKEADDVLAESCKILDKTLLEIQNLRKTLEAEKQNISTKYNINKTKVKFIKESIISGNYTYKNNNIIFRVINSKYNESFYLEEPLNEFISQILSDTNKNLRIDNYL